MNKIIENIKAKIKLRKQKKAREIINKQLAAFASMVEAKLEYDSI